jgi:hypothetical protein
VDLNLRGAVSRKLITYEPGVEEQASNSSHHLRRRGVAVIKPVTTDHTLVLTVSCRLDLYSHIHTIMLSVAARRSLQRGLAPVARGVSTWQAVPTGPPDAILGSTTLAMFSHVCCAKHTHI